MEKINDPLFYIKPALSRIHPLRKNEGVDTAISLTASIIMLSRPLWKTSMKMVVILKDKIEMLILFLTVQTAVTAAMSVFHLNVKNTQDTLNCKLPN